MDKYSFFKFFNRDLRHLQNYQIDQIFQKKKNYRNRILDQDSFNMRYPFLNLEFYKSNYLDLSDLNKYELMYHYHFNGRLEKRICNISEFKKRFPSYEEEIKNIDLKMAKVLVGEEVDFEDKTKLYIFMKLKFPNIFHIKKVKNEIIKLKHNKFVGKKTDDTVIKSKCNEYINDKLLQSSEKLLDYIIIQEGNNHKSICHIHLTSNFNYNKNKINTLKNKFSIIFTYSNIRNVMDKESTYLKVDNKGGKYFGQLVCLNYLKKKNINFNSLLFLDRDIDIFQNINSLDNVLTNFENNEEVKVIFDKLEYKPHKNKYFEELCSEWNLVANNVKNNGFTLIKKEILDTIIFDFNLLYSLFNKQDSLDLNWVSNYYNLQHLNIIKLKENIDNLELCYNSYQKNVCIDFMFEDIFNYIWINIAINYDHKIYTKDICDILKSKELIKNYKIIDFDNINDDIFEDNITNAFLNDDKIISLKEFYSFLTSIKSNNTNITQIFYNLFKTNDNVNNYLSHYNLDFNNINKNIKTICDNYVSSFQDNVNDFYFLINLLMNDFDLDVYKLFNLDLSKYSDEDLFEQWILYGFYEGRIYSKNKFYSTYPQFNKKKFGNSKQIDEIFNKNFKLLNKAELFKYEVVYHYSQIYKIDLSSENLNDMALLNKNNNFVRTALIIHCGNYEIFTEIYKEYPDLFNVFQIFISCHTYEIKEKLSFKFKDAIIIVCENKGMDIGGRLKIIDYIKKLDFSYDYYIMIHTKTDKKWRDLMLKPLNYMMNNINKFEISNEPRIYSSFDNVEPNYKLTNTKNIIKILKRNKMYNNSVDEYYDELYPENFYTKNNDINIYGGLQPSDKFYENYEKIDIQHFYKYGLTEFHRISNINYIKNFATKNNNFVAGTCFICNNKYFDILKKIDDIDFEYNQLERGKTFNKTERKTHSWEYLFGLVCYLNNGDIVDIYSNNFIKSNRHFKKYSLINVPFSKSRIAFSLIIPNGEFINGGYRTLLKYIDFINKQGESVDIYFGECWNEKELLLNYTPNNHGMPTCLNWYQEDIEYYIEQINKYNVINVNKNNFYVGLNFQRNYKYGIANAWQTAEGVYKNIEKCENIMYIIQDREYLFYNDEQLVNICKSTYKPEFKYYYISKYLCNFYQNKYKFPNYIQSQLSANNDIYYDMNLKRENKVILFYYPDKKGRLPKLIKEIAIKISDEQIECIVLPFNFESNSKYIKFFDPLKPEKLNELYNKCKVGIVFSNTNPSRLCYEMFFSGLNVIEYENEFTKYDVSNECFTKIKNSHDIVNIVNKLFKEGVDSNLKTRFIKKYNETNELNKFYKTLI